jgi:RNA polymerase sigma factor (sigma-70 family)
MATAQLDTLMRHIKELAAGRAGRPGTDRQLLDDFACRGDERAFAGLVGRHGPMVLRVCRRVLRHEQDAEDAFQATFLVLARSTASIHQRETLASWLYGVAYRTAMRAKRGAARRRTHEARLRDRTPPATVSPTWDDVQAVLDEEIRRLPESFRSAFVLCVLDGKTVLAAAAELGAKEGTVSWRLARARQWLRQRLARRGIQLSSVLAALAVAQGASEAAVPAGLAGVTVRFALSVAAGEPAAAIPPHVAALAAGVTRAMFVTRAKVTAALLLAAGLVLAGAGALARQALAAGGPPPASERSEISAPQPEQPTAKEPAKPPAADDRDRELVTYSGQVFGPDGRPVAGAKVYQTLWWGYHYKPFESLESATSGRDGRFEFTTPAAKQKGQPAIVSAAALNLGVGWVGLHAQDKRTGLTLKLVADDVPITGQIVDLEGKPVAGATLRLLQVMASPKEDLGPWLAAAKDKTAPPAGRDLEIIQKYMPRYTTAPSTVVTTDAAGRFRLTGIGRERVVILRLEGPTVASEYLHVRTRPGEAIKVGLLEADREYGTPRIDTTYYGADFRHVAGPTKPVIGVVRDRDTKKPLAGFTVQSEKLAHSPYHGTHITQTVTDAEGRYQLTGLPKGAGNKINVVPPRDQPYVAPVIDVADSFGPGPVSVDVELKRAVWIEGRLTDKTTGKSLPGHHIMYLVRDGNPNQKEYAEFWGGMPTAVTTKEDGSYRIIGLPGPGLLAVHQDHKEDYLLGAERDDEDGLHEPFGYMPQSNFAAFARIDPAKGSETVRRDIALVRGWTFTGTLLGPDGKPLAGAVLGGSGEPLKTAEFTVRRFNPRRPRSVFFRHPAKGLVGLAQPPQEDGGSVNVRMIPAAAIKGRLVDAEGSPRAGVELWVSFLPREEPHWNEHGLGEQIKTDRDGRFRIDALLPGLEYFMSLDHTGIRIGQGLRAGETKDLGDIRSRGTAP